MESWSDSELIEVYEAMFQSQMDGTLNTLEESLRFMAICSLLGERGYRLTPDESTWIRKDRHTNGE
jgi:hypothetical protein